MAQRPPNYRRVKISRSYAVDEIACLFGIHKNYRARKGEGRTPDQRRKRPVLILENDLAAFLEARRAGHNRPRKAEEFYCFRCRSPKPPQGRWRIAGR